MGVNADFYRNLVIFRGGGGLNPHIPAPLDPRMLTLDLLIASAYISDHVVYLNPRPVFTGMTNEFYQKNCFTSEFLLFCRLKDPKDYYASKYIEFTESSTRNPQAKRWSP